MRCLRLLSDSHAPRKRAAHRTAALGTENKNCDSPRFLRHSPVLIKRGVSGSFPSSYIRFSCATDYLWTRLHSSRSFSLFCVTVPSGRCTALPRLGWRTWLDRRSRAYLVREGWRHGPSSWLGRLGYSWRDRLIVLAAGSDAGLVRPPPWLVTSRSKPVWLWQAATRPRA